MHFAQWVVSLFIGVSLVKTKPSLKKAKATPQTQEEASQRLTPIQQAPSAGTWRPWAQCRSHPSSSFTFNSNSCEPSVLIGVGSNSIPFNHCSFQKPELFSWAFDGFLKRRIPRKNGEGTAESNKKKCLGRCGRNKKKVCP